MVLTAPQRNGTLLTRPARVSLPLLASFISIVCFMSRGIPTACFQHSSLTTFNWDPVSIMAVIGLSPHIILRVISFSSLLSYNSALAALAGAGALVVTGATVFFRLIMSDS